MKQGEGQPTYREQDAEQTKWKPKYVKQDAEQMEQTERQPCFFLLTIYLLKVAIHSKCSLQSHLLMYFGSQHCKQYGLRSEIASEYDQEIPQSQTADKPTAPRGRATQSSQDTRKTN